MRLLTSLICSALLFAVGCDKADEGTEPAPAKSGEGNAAGNGTVSANPPAGAVAFSNDNASISFTGYKPSGEKHDGKFETFSGTFKFDKENLAESSVQVTIDMNAIWTDAGNRLTGHLKNEDFFEVIQYPESIFESSALAHVDGDNYNITGNLTLHGVTKEITMPATITEADGKLEVAIDYNLKRSDFGMNFNLDGINDEVPLSIRISADQA